MRIRVAICSLLVGCILAPVSQLRSFDRVLLLEDKGETSAGVSIGDLNGDNLPDIVAARSDAANGIWFSTPR